MAQPVIKHFLQYPKRNTALARNLRQSMTIAERKLWSKLRNNQLGVKFRRQVPFGNYILDFLAIECKLVVEVDGSQHFSDEGEAKDKIRDKELSGHGLVVLRFSNHDVLMNMNGVLDAIYSEVQRRKPK
jgi:very-short-patch-repair endonuclease